MTTYLKRIGDENRNSRTSPDRGDPQEFANGLDEQKWIALATGKRITCFLSVGQHTGSCVIDELTRLLPMRSVESELRKKSLPVYLDLTWRAIIRFTDINIGEGHIDFKMT